MTNSLRRTAFTAAAVISLAASTGSAQSVTTTVDSVRHEVIISATPFDVPGMVMSESMPGMEHATMDMDHGPLKLLRFDWPVDAYAKGFRVEVRDSRGALLPRGLLHHLIGINLDRRQFIYPATERLFAIGKETEAVSLPGALAVPLEKGQRLGFYVAWHNDTGRDLKNISVRVIMNWVPSTATRQLVAVLPIYIDVNNDVGGDDTFDVTPGKSRKAFEFSSPVTGKLLAVGGHLHDYGSAVQLEDAETGQVLVRLNADRDKNGHVKSMPRKFYAFNALALKAGHRYRVVAEYESPLHETIKDGAMANMVGAIAPDNPKLWPAIDPDDPTFLKDIRSLGIRSWKPSSARENSSNDSRQ